MDVFTSQKGLKIQIYWAVQTMYIGFIMLFAVGALGTGIAGSIYPNRLDLVTWFYVVGIIGNFIGAAGTFAVYTYLIAYYKNQKQIELRTQVNWGYIGGFVFFTFAMLADVAIAVVAGRTDIGMLSNRRNQAIRGLFIASLVCTFVAMMGDFIAHWLYYEFMRRGKIEKRKSGSFTWFW